LLLNLNLTYENGIRLDVDDENNLGPFVSRTEALSGIRALLEEGAADLENGGEDFPFILSSGFDGFDDPTSFIEVNKAISARVAAYQEDYPAVLAFLEDSFLSLDAANLDEGIYYNFSLDQRDILNPLFQSIEGLTAANARIVQPDFVTDAEEDDNRLDKIVELDSPIMQDDLSGTYAVFRYPTNTSDIPIIRNEELILLYAEASIFTDQNEAVEALNIVRSSAGLDDYDGPTSETALIDEMLMQRRYSLYAEGHRWIDMRRYDRLNELPTDRPEDDVFVQFPIPLTENQ